MLPRFPRGPQPVPSAFGALWSKCLDALGGSVSKGCTCMTFESSSLLVLPSLGCSLDSSGRLLDAFRTPLYHLGSVALEHPLETWKSNRHSQSFHGLQGAKCRSGSQSMVFGFLCSVLVPKTDQGGLTDGTGRGRHTLLPVLLWEKKHCNSTGGKGLLLAADL